MKISAPLASQPPCGCRQAALRSPQSCLFLRLFRATPLSITSQGQVSLPLDRLGGPSTKLTAGPACATPRSISKKCSVRELFCGLNCLPEGWVSRITYTIAHLAFAAITLQLFLRYGTNDNTPELKSSRIFFFKEPQRSKSGSHNSHISQ